MGEPRPRQEATSESTKAPRDFRSKYTEANFITRRLLDGFFGAAGDLLGDLQARSALEVGCGEGFSTVRLRRLLGPEVAFEASDVDEHLVHAAAAANPDVPISQESVYELARAAKSVDLVIVLEVLEHLEEPARAMRELCRVARRWVIASVPREPIWRILNLARLRYVARLGDTPGHLQHWSARAFRRFMERFCRVRAWRKPLPWTIILGEVRLHEQIR